MADSIDPSARLAFLEADNARLRRLLDAAVMSDGLRDTVAMLRTVIRQSAETAGDVEGYVAHLDGRLDAITRVRATADAFGEADLHALVSDELLFHLAREGERASIGGPRLRLRPKAAQVLALAVHELASNAVEHGVLSDTEGRVDVTWQAAQPGTGTEPAITLVWKETGGTGLAAPSRRGFGISVLEETLAYELEAHTALAFEPDGLRCMICFPLASRIGRLAGGNDEEEDGEAL